MASLINFTGPGGVDPTTYILNLKNLATPTAADCLLAGQFSRARIRERTAQGVDSQGVQFAPYSEGYARQKSKYLGHSDSVDLFGYQNHPHMLNSIMVSVNGQMFGENTAGAGNQPTTLFQIGIYDNEAAARAQVHNEGATVRTRAGSGKVKSFASSRASKQPHLRASLATARAKALSFNMPRRHFFDVNQQDVQDMERIIAENIEARMKAQQ